MTAEHEEVLEGPRPPRRWPMWLFGVAALAVLTVGVVRDSGPQVRVVRVPATTTYLPSCPTEDSTNCVWVASEHGNGKGRSFITWHGRIYVAPPVDHRDEHGHVYNPLSSPTTGGGPTQ